MASSPTTSHPRDEKDLSIDPAGSMPSLAGKPASDVDGFDSEGRKLYGGASIIPMVSNTHAAPSYSC